MGVIDSNGRSVCGHDPDRIRTPVFTGDLGKTHGYFGGRTCIKVK